MNLNLQTSFPRLHCRSIPLTTLRITQLPSEDPIVFFKSNWTIFGCEDLVILDYQTTIFLKFLRQLINNYIIQPASYEEELCRSLELLIKTVKKLDFYRLSHYIPRILFEPDGLMALYKYAENLQLIKLLTELEKEFDMTGVHFDRNQKIEQYGIYSNALSEAIQRFSAGYLSKIQASMCQQCTITNFFWQNQCFCIDPQKSFRENFQQFLNARGTNLKKKDVALARFTMLIQCQLKNKKQICNFLVILKNHLLNKRSNSFSQHVQLWNKIFQISLKIYARDDNTRKKQWLQIDQILSTPHQDTSFCEFIKQAEVTTDNSISLSSMNFFLKNQSKSVKKQLKEAMLTKINYLIKDQYLVWKNAQDIIQYMESQIQQEDCQAIQLSLSNRIVSLIKNKIDQTKNFFDYESGYSYVLQYFGKSQQKFHFILNQNILNIIIDQLTGTNLQKSKKRIIHQTIQNFLDFSFAESNQIQNYLIEHKTEAELLFTVFKHMKSYNCYFTPIVIKILTDLVLSRAVTIQAQTIFWDYLSLSLLTASTTDQLEIDLILEQHQKIQEKIGDYTLAILNKFTMIQLAQRQELEKYLNNREKFPQNFVNSYLAVKGFKEGFLGNNLLVAGVLIAKFIPFDDLANIMAEFFTPLTMVKPWRSNEPLFVSFDNITQQFPIQSLKHVFIKLKAQGQANVDWTTRINKPCFWTNFWQQDRSKFIQKFTGQENIDIDFYDSLHDIRKMQIVLNLMNSVFDKLNESSQRNIKQIKEIYKMGIEYAQGLYNQLLPILGRDLAQYHHHRSNEYNRRKSDPRYQGLDERTVIINSRIGSSNDKFSFIESKMLSRYSIFTVFNTFNNIGEVIKSKSYFRNSFALNRMKQISEKSGITEIEGFCKIIQTFMIIQRSWPCFFQIKIENQQEANFSQDPKTEDYLYKQLETSLQELTQYLQLCPEAYEKNPYVNKYCKYMQQGLSRIFIPKLIELSMRQISALKEDQLNHFINRQFCLYHKLLTLADKLYPDEQEHFIIMMEVIEQTLIQQKIEENHIKIYILNMIQLLLKCIFQGIRVRSYHLFRLITKYNEIDPERLPFFNKIILHYVKYIFEKYIPTYQHSKQVLSKIVSKDQQSMGTQLLKKGQDLKKFKPNFNPVKGACTLSMFVNLFLRLNYMSLQQGIQSIFAEQKSKFLFLDYLISLTKKIAQLNDEKMMSKRQRDIMSIDVYGNLQIIFKKAKKAIYLSKFVQLTKCMFSVKFDMKNANITPLQLLTQTALFNRNQIALEEFEQEQKALSLAILSYHQKISSGINSNLHLCNLSYLQGKSNFNSVKTFELNSGLLMNQMTKTQYRSMIRNLQKNKQNLLPEPDKDLKIAINKEVVNCVENLLQKFSKQYELAKLSLQESQIKKLYNYFKILMISCLNNPEIIPQFYKYKLKQSRANILDLMIDSLRFCFIMFLEFYLMILKTNSHFVRFQNIRSVPANILYEMEIKNRILKEVQKCVYQPKQNTLTDYHSQALGFIVMHSSGYRFRCYRFMKNNNEDHQTLMQKFEKEYEDKLFSLLISKLNQKSLSGKGLYSWLFLARIVFGKVINTNNIQHLKYILHQDLVQLFKNKNEDNSQKSIQILTQSTKICPEKQNLENNILKNSNKFSVNLPKDAFPSKGKSQQGSILSQLINSNFKSAQKIFLMDKNTIKVLGQKSNNNKGFYMQTQLLNVFDLQLLPNIAPDFQPNGSLRSMETFKNLGISCRGSLNLQGFNQKINKAFSNYLVQCLDKLEKKDLLMSVAQNFYDQNDLEQYISSREQHRLSVQITGDINTIGSASMDIAELIRVNQTDQFNDSIVESQNQIFQSGDAIIESRDIIQSQKKLDANSVQCNDFIVQSLEELVTLTAFTSQGFQQNQNESNPNIQKFEDQPSKDCIIEQSNEEDSGNRRLVDLPVDGSIEVIQEKPNSHSHSSNRSNQNSISKTNSVEEYHAVETYNKQSIMKLIQQYALNPEVIRIITARLPKIGTLELQAIQLQTDGQLRHRVRCQLKSRGIFNFSSDEGDVAAKQNIYAEEALANMIKQHAILHKNKLLQTVDSIPLLSQQNMRYILYEIFQIKEQIEKLDKNSNSKKAQLKSRIEVYSSVLSKIILRKQNLLMMVNECVRLLTVGNQQFFELNQQQHCSASFKSIKNTVINYIFVMLVQYKLGLPLLFRGHWNHKISAIEQYSNCQITNLETKQNNKSDTTKKESEAIMQIVLKILLFDFGNSEFINTIQEYIDSSKSQDSQCKILHQDIQQSLCFNQSFLQQISNLLRKKFTSFVSNPSLLKFFRIIVFLDSSAFQLFFSIEIQKIKAFLQCFLSKQLGIINYFKSNYLSLNGERKDFDNKMKLLENYWQLRAQKKMQKFQEQAIFTPKIISELAFSILPYFKQNRLNYHHSIGIEQFKKKITQLQQELDMKMGEQYEQTAKKLSDSKAQLECWRGLQLGQITKTQITPVIQEYANELKQQLQMGKSLLSELHQIFGTEDQEVMLVAYNLALVGYKISLAFESICKQETLNYHSMALLKTKPSLHSYNSFRNSHQSSARKSFKLSIIQHQSEFKIQRFNKSIARMCPHLGKLLEGLKDLLEIHCEYSDIESKLLLIQRKTNQQQKPDKIIECSRQNVWFDSIRQMDKQFARGNVKIKFKGQIGIDYGGISRQWVTLIVKQLFNPDLGLFELSVNKRAMQPSPNSSVVPHHLMHFEKLGILVGKAMKQNWLLEINFTKSFLKHLLGKTLYVEDLEDIDPDTSKGLLWILNNQVDQDLGINFVAEVRQLSNKKRVDLVPNGTNIYVNQENKKDYVRRMALFKMTQTIRNQTKAFMKGLQKVVSYTSLKLFTAQQFGMYLAGVPEIDVNQMKKSAKYDGCCEQDEHIKWFWNTIGQWDEKTKANFLFFLTGSYKLPYGGFKQYPITIVKVNGCTDFLPVAHTCFSIIDLPDYTSELKLKTQVQLAIQQGKGFSVS